MINFRKFFRGLNIKPKTVSESNEQGDLEVLSTDGKLRHHNGSSNSPVVTEAHSASLTNKTIDADQNTITNIDNADIKVGAAIARDKLASGSANRVVVNDASGVQSDAAAITASRALISDANGIPTHSVVTDTELSYVSGVTSAIQTQINAKTSQTDFDNHLNDVSDAHDASAISNVPSGNLAATDVQAALNELQSDVDTRATSTDLTAHTSASSGVHGVTGSVVGTSDSQVLTNKDIDGGTASNTSRITVPKAAKATLDSLTRKEATIVFATDEDRLYVDDGTNLLPVGSGVGGINLVTLDSNLLPNKQSNSDAEISLGDWAAYADAAASTPVDATGGSPNVTITRTTTSGEKLNGNAAFKITKDAANRQGEGVSLLVNIPEAYRDTQLTLRFPFKILSGSIAQNDVKLFFYDVTNSQLIAPQNNDIVGSYGQAFALFSVPRSCTQGRLAVHFASTSTTAVTIAFDDVIIEPSRTSIGGITTDWELDNNFAISGAGTISDSVFFRRRVGDTMQLRGYFTTGTVSGTTASIDLPSYLAIDSSTSKLGSATNAQRLGVWGLIGGATANINLDTASNNAALFYDGSDTTKVYFSSQSNSGQYVKQGGSTIWNSSGRVEFFLNAIPIRGWSSNVALTSSSTYRMSNLLATGTRVTTTPARLGEYRARYKSASSQNISSWTDTEPATAPSATSGFRLYAVNYVNAGTATQADTYEIFIGKNKFYSILGYASTGFSGPLSIDYSEVSTSVSVGIYQNYDPNTGVLVITAGLHSASNTSSSFVGVGNTGNFVSDGYFDVVVSENALAVGVESPRSEIYIKGHTGFGSTLTNVIRWNSPTISLGNDVTFLQSATNGDRFVINTDGVYTVRATAVFTSSAYNTALYLAVNGTRRTANVLNPSSGVGVMGTMTVFLRSGDYVDARAAGSLSIGASNVNENDFHITKVSN